MKRHLTIFGRVLLAFSIFMVLVSCDKEEPASAATTFGFKVLVFTETAGFRHGSIPDGVQAIKRLGENNNFAVDVSNVSEVFIQDNLSQYAAVIFLNTTGDVLTDEQQSVFESYIKSGGGFVGVHSACDTEYQWPWYGSLLGAYFHSHPQVQQGTLNIMGNAHLSTIHLPEKWTRIDEWYNMVISTNQDLNILIMIDENSYVGGNMNNKHPISWFHEYDGGRSWYTAMGHTKESFTEELYLMHLLGGIFWVAGK